MPFSALASSMDETTKDRNSQPWVEMSVSWKCEADRTSLVTRDSSVAAESTSLASDDYRFVERRLFSSSDTRFQSWNMAIHEIS